MRASSLAWWIPGISSVLLLFGCGGTDLGEARGNAVAAPAALDFGATAIGQSVEEVVLVRNLGRARFEGRLEDLASDFSVDEATLGLAPGERRFLSIRFSPTVVGTRAGLVRFRSPDGTVADVQVAGVGIVTPMRSEGALDFGDVRVGERRVIDFELFSDVDHELSYSISGPEHSAFQVFGRQISIPPRGNTWGSISFQPDHRGKYEGAIDFSGCKSCSIEVHGTGTDLDFTIEPAYIDFKVVAVGYSDERTITIRNTGDFPIDAEIGEPIGPFSLRQSSPEILLDPEEQAQVHVRFTPREKGLRGFPLQIRERTSLRATSIPVTGTGGSILIASPTELDFGEVPIGAKVRRMVALRNVGLPRSVHVKSVIYAHHSPAFRVVDLPVGADIGASDVWVSIEFQTFSVGPYTSELILITDDPAQQLKVPLLARGVEPPKIEAGCELGSIPSRVRWGIARTLMFHTTKVYLTNTGSAPCHVLYGVDPLVVDPGDHTPVEIRRFFVGKSDDGTCCVEYTGSYSLFSVLGDLDSDFRIPQSKAGQYGLGPDSPLPVPNLLEFGPLQIGGEEILSFAIEDGTRAYRLRSVTLSDESSPDFWLEGALPTGGVPVDGVVIQVGFRPSSPGIHYGQVELFLAGALGGDAVRITLLGMGEDE